MRFLIVAVWMAMGIRVVDAGVEIGWGMADLTPDWPVAMRGGVKSEGVMDPVTATVLLVKQEDEVVVMVSCDWLQIPDGSRHRCNVRDGVRARVVEQVPELVADKLFLFATHTHVAPVVTADLKYESFATARIVEAVVAAWNGRKAGSVAFGLGHAVLGHNRIASYTDGSSRMVGALQKGSTGSVDFRHLEGFEDHSVHLLYTFDLQGGLTGVVVNTPCPAQVKRGKLISADFWHEAREEIRRRLGEGLPVLVQLSAAGDLATTVMVERKAEQRMAKLQFAEEEDERVQRMRQLGMRVADAVSATLEVVRETREADLVVRHVVGKVDLPGGFPEPVAGADPFPIEIHAVRLGEVGMVSNPFELYLDYGVRMKGRSPAVQTFVVQLAGSGSYLPTERAVKGGAYGAIPRTSVVGPVAGDEIVKVSLELLNQLWETK